MQLSSRKTLSKISLRRTTLLRQRPYEPRRQRNKYLLQFISTLIIPLVLGVFTIVTTFHQQKLAREQRLEDLNESRSQRQREEQHQRELADTQYKDQLLVAYIKDLAELLEKYNGSLTYDKIVADIARVKTLNIFRQLDAQRTIHIVRFLYEAEQLNSTPKRVPLDLALTKLKDIDFRELAVNQKRLYFLSLPNVFLYNATFSELQMEGNDFANTEFHNATLSSVQFAETNFMSSLFNNTDFYEAHIRQCNFSLAKFFNVDFSFASIFNVDLTYARLTSVNSSNSLISKADFKHNALQNVNFSFSKLFDVDFAFTQRMVNINFSNALLNNISMFSFITIENIDFSYAQVALINGSRIKLRNANFSNTSLYDTTFFKSQLENVNFSSAILIRTDFYYAVLRNTDFRQTTCTRTRFTNAHLSYCNFCNSNLKYSVFFSTYLMNIDFTGANLYKADFSLTTISDDQLRSALSIQDVMLPNGTLANDTNLINNGEADCNTSLSRDWTLLSGIVVVSMSDKNNGNCHFSLQSSITGAAMSQRVNISNKWDSISWPYSKAVLSASMSTNVSLILRGINAHRQITTQATIKNSDERVNIVLEDAVQELEVLINFKRVINGTNNNILWCDNIRLFIIYGTYAEQMQGTIIPNLPINARWEQNGVTVAGWHGKGENNTQLSDPHGLLVDDDIIIIADAGNNRIVQYKRGDTSGQVIAGGNGDGDQLDQLSWPTDLLIDKETNSIIIADKENRRIVRWSRLSDTKQGEKLIDDIDCYGLAMDVYRNLYVSDMEKHEVRRYVMDRGDQNGTVVAGGNSEGNGLNQLSVPEYIFVDKNQSLYVADYRNNRVMRWDKGAIEGIVVAGGQGEGKDLTQLRFPYGIFVDVFGTVYVAEAGNDRITRWPKGSKQGTVVVGENEHAGAYQLYSPIRVSFDKHGNLYVCDSMNYRVQRFTRQ